MTNGWTAWENWLPTDLLLCQSSRPINAVRGVSAYERVQAIKKFHFQKCPRPLTGECLPTGTHKHRVWLGGKNGNWEKLIMFMEFVWYKWLNYYKVSVSRAVHLRVSVSRELTVVRSCQIPSGVGRGSSPSRGGGEGWNIEFSTFVTTAATCSPARMDSGSLSSNPL